MIFVTFVLRGAAIQSRKTMLAYLSAEPPEPLRFTTLTVGECQSRVETMQVWPVAYLKFNQLLVIAVVCLLCLVFYRIGLLLIGVAIATVVTRAIRAIKSTG